MARVTDALRALGAEVRPAPGGLPPIIGSGGGRLRGADVALGQASAQVGSSVLLAALRAEGTTVVRYPAPVRDHTERLLAQMGASIDWDGHATTLDGPVEHLSSLGTMRMPADISAAAFLLAACRVVPGSSIRLTGVGVNPGRAGIVDLMVAMGAGVVLGDAGEECGEPTASITVESGPLQAVQFGMPLIPRLIDELPLVAVLATQARGRTEVRDAGELRVKESDRLVAMVDGLSRLGARIESRPDGFVVEGPSPLVGAEVDGHGDHRVVMAMAVAGLVAEGETVIHDAERVADSFPGFVAALTTLGAPVELR